MRLIVVVGARPNFIKAGPLMPALAAAGIAADLVHTGQHYDAAMSDVFFDDLELARPRWNLDVGSGTHAVQTGLAMIRLEELFSDERPDAVIVVGDVNSTLAGALAAAKIGLPVVHLEAGLRSHDMSMPEEVNRVVTDQLATLLLASTSDGPGNLAAEGISSSRVVFVSNIMAESLLRNMERVAARTPADAFGCAPGTYALVTVHRPENVDDPDNLREVAEGLGALDMPVVFPMHPRTRERLAGSGIPSLGPHVRVIDPVGYLDMLALQRDALVVVTDSGGVQEEACVLGTPCVTVRRNTERQVTIDVGANRLVPATREAIMGGVADACAHRGPWPLPDRWDTDVSARTVDALRKV